MPQLPQQVIADARARDAQRAIPPIEGIVYPPLHRPGGFLGDGDADVWERLFVGFQNDAVIDRDHRREVHPKRVALARQQQNPHRPVRHIAPRLARRNGQPRRLLPRRHGCRCGQIARIHKPAHFAGLQIDRQPRLQRAASANFEDGIFAFENGVG